MLKDQPKEHVLFNLLVGGPVRSHPSFPISNVTTIMNAKKYTLFKYYKLLSWLCVTMSLFN